MTSKLAWGIAALVVAFGCGSSSSESPGPKTPGSQEPQLEEGPQSDDTGFIDVTCSPTMKVKIDGKELGDSPVAGYKVSPGSHDVACIDDDGPHTQSVAVEAGKSVGWRYNHIPKIQEAPTPEKKK